MYSASDVAVLDSELGMDEWFVAADEAEDPLADRLAAVWAEELDRLVSAGAQPEALRQAS